uniref:Uncharacterized protein n=1 Tax=Timema genevievae TaxID=629358 RepID=A0A7R9K469_TIMGE|nr:unnamed protein product [Timema genevievae]
MAVTSRRERYNLFNGMVCLIQALKGKFTMIDLRNESTVTGKIDEVDGGAVVHTFRGDPLGVQTGEINIMAPLLPQQHSCIFETYKGRCTSNEIVPLVSAKIQQNPQADDIPPHGFGIPTHFKILIHKILQTNKERQN